MSGGPPSAAWFRRLVSVVLYGTAVLWWWPDAAGGAKPARAQVAPSAGDAGMRLAEIGPLPRPDADAFVELVNTGTTDLDVRKLALRVGEHTVLFHRLAQPVRPGGIVLVRFDGRNTVEGLTIHARDGVEVPAAGRAELRDETDQTIDEVAWGREPGAVRDGLPTLSRRARTVAGAIGRPPGSTAAADPSAWVIYPPASVTPGAPNPMPPVVDMSPQDGAILDAGAVTLDWLPVPGATGYRVQVATDAAFTAVIAEPSVTDPSAELGALAARRYYWRVQASGPGIVRSSYSESRTFEVTAPGGLLSSGTVRTHPGVLLSVAARSGHELQLTRRLKVPYLTQHKDSPLLLLESNQKTGQHAWDKDHQSPSRHDKADQFNCALANTAIVNRFFGGDLTQDRIGIEVMGAHAPLYNARLRGEAIRVLLDDDPSLLDEVKPGPERDMPWGKGIDGVRLTAALLFALGVEPDVQMDFSSWDEFFGHVVDEIDQGRPVVAANTHHTVTITGYLVRGSRNLVYIHDPANGRYIQDLAASRFRPDDFTLWKLKPGSTGRRQEASVTMDSDGDGVMNFDEVERFRTNPNDPDSDHDGVKDKEDIASGVFEIEHRYGYAMGGPGASRGRDYDRDGEPTERDADSDNGGCRDGEEDLDADGMHAGRETGNFDETDDVCGSLQGSVTFVQDYIHDEGGGMEMRGASSLTVMVRLAPDVDLGPGHFKDNGSTFVYSGVGHLIIRHGPGCITYSRHTSQGGGLFRGEGFSIGATIGEGTGTLAFDAAGSATSDVVNDYCGPIGSNSGTLETSFSLPYCEGRESPRGSRDFVFNCTTAPTLPGGRFLRWRVNGRLKLVPQRLAPSAFRHIW